MRKATILAIAVALLGMFSIEANAQAGTSPSTQQPQPVASSAVKQQITADDLPKRIQRTLKKDDVLTDWEVSEIYRIAAGAASKATVYEVYFTNAEQKRAFARFDEEGNAVTASE